MRQRYLSGVGTAGYQVGHDYGVVTSSQTGGGLRRLHGVVIPLEGVISGVTGYGHRSAAVGRTVTADATFGIGVSSYCLGPWVNRDGHRIGSHRHTHEAVRRAGDAQEDVEHVHRDILPVFREGDRVDVGPLFFRVAGEVVVKQVVTVDVTLVYEVVLYVRTHVVLHHDHGAVETFPLSVFTQADGDGVGDFITLTNFRLVGHFGYVEQDTTVVRGVLVRYRRAVRRTVLINRRTGYRSGIRVNTNGSGCGQRQGNGLTDRKAGDGTHQTFHVVGHDQVDQVNRTVVGHYVLPLYCRRFAGTRAGNQVDRRGSGIVYVSVHEGTRRGIERSLLDINHWRLVDRGFYAVLVVVVTVAVAVLVFRIVGVGVGIDVVAVVSRDLRFVFHTATLEVGGNGVRHVERHRCSSGQVSDHVYAVGSGNAGRQGLSYVDQVTVGGIGDFHVGRVEGSLVGRGDRVGQFRTRSDGIGVRAGQFFGQHEVVHLVHLNGGFVLVVVVTVAVAVLVLVRPG